ncbi:MAG TPA: phosphoglucosamine mutase [Opitutales bacterium]|nr:phosphoglucosamine mutase [Opitutales bacterium]
MTSVQPRYFGTDGIRGVFGEPPLDPPFLRRLGYALARHIAVRTPGRRLEIVMGRDPRESGPAILAALAEGLLASGHRVLDLGVTPTPAVPEALLAHRADFGVMITASHNPAADNGVKFFDRSGLKLDEATEIEIETWVDRVQAPEPPAGPPALETFEALESYRLLRMRLLPPHSLAGWVIAMDCGHGATCATTPEVFRRLGADVRARAVNPDGAHINEDSGSEHPEHLAALVRASGARLGLAHDGDGDRLVVCDETGALVDGDELLGILALHALRGGTLKQNLVVATVQSNLGLDRALAAAGGRVERVPVGDRQVLHKLLELGASFGGENSGHYIFTDISRCGDGLLAALRLVRVLRDTGRPLSDLRKDIPLLPQRTANLRVRVKTPFEELPLFGETLRGAQAALNGRGRVLARYSGTEKKLRLLVEGPAPQELDMLLGALKLAAARELGAG